MIQRKIERKNLGFEVDLSEMREIGFLEREEERGSTEEMREREREREKGFK